MVIKYLSKLVSFKTLSEDHAENRRSLEWIQKELKGLPLIFRKFSFNGFPSLVVLTKNTKAPKVWLAGHLDVVDGSRQVFLPKILGGKLFGRGTFDMKFAIASYMAFLKESGKPLSQYSIGMMITTDEEIGGENGVKKLLEKGFRGEVCILPDGGENWTVQKGAKGTWRVIVTSSGKSGHGSRPWTGVNAVSELMDFLVEAQKLFPKEPCQDLEHIHNTLNVGIIKGGTEANKIPDFAEAVLDIRFIAKEKRKQLEEKLKQIAKKFPGIKLQESLIGSAYSLPMQNPLVRQFTELVKQEIGREPEYIVSHGSSDARYFLERGIPAILTRPVGAGHHSEKEWISVKSLERFHKLLKEYLNKVAKAK